MPFSTDQWVADWARREGLETEAMLPEPLRLRKEIDRLPAKVAKLRSEEQVREVVEDLNLRIKEWIRYPDGPQYVVVLPVDADAVVEEWRQTRRKPAEVTARPSEPPPRRAPWWRQAFRRR